MNFVRLLIADEHRPIAEGLQGLLEPEFEVVNVLTNGYDVLAAARVTHADVIVVDISLPGLNGIDVIRQLRQEGNTAKAIVLGTNDDVVYAARALKAGASGYVLKQMVSGEIATAIRTVLSGTTYVSPKIDGELTMGLESPRED